VSYLLDTNVISELISRKPNQKIIDWIDSLDPEMVYLSVITIGEIRKGIEKLAASQRKDNLASWLETNLLLRFAEKLVDINVDVVLVWGELTGRMERDGTPLAAIDSLIAASALAGNHTLVTRNEDDFRATGVSIVNPWKL
jgi:tRNA(fMet)-specific endonuclease VapC